MSTSALCPECKARQVPESRYLCAQCEAALVKATNGDGDKKARPSRLRARSCNCKPFRINRHWSRMSAPVAVEEEEAEVRTPSPFRLLDQRPSWMQYSFMVSLITIGVMWAWCAKAATDGRHDTRIALVSQVHDTMLNISHSWRNLNDAISK